MAKAVLISIQPQWCELIANGIKTLEVRKSRPKLETPFKCYIYCTNTRPFLVWGDVFRGDWSTEFTHLSGYSREEAERIWDVFNGKVMGEFACDDCSLLTKSHYGYIEKQGRIPEQFLRKYMGLEDGHELDYEDGCYGWHITNLEVYDTPKELSEFMKPCKSDLYCEVCAMFREFEDRCGNKSLMISKAPQSWCYVEELKGGDG